MKINKIYIFVILLAFLLVAVSAGQTLAYLTDVDINSTSFDVRIPESSEAAEVLAESEPAESDAFAVGADTQ